MLPSGSLGPEALALTASGALPVRGVSTSAAVGGRFGCVMTRVVVAEPPSALAAVKTTAKLPVSPAAGVHVNTPDCAFAAGVNVAVWPAGRPARFTWTDRKSTRLNSSHLGISYAV